MHKQMPTLMFKTKGEERRRGGEEGGGRGGGGVGVGLPPQMIITAPTE